MEKKRKILIVDDNITNLSIARKALCDEYSVVLIKDGAMALAELPNIKPDIILLDVEMPGLSGFDVIKVIKNNMEDPYKNIPVIFLTAKDDSSSEYEGLSLGAVDYVIKPFSAVLLKKRVELHLKLYDYSTDLERIVEEKTSHIKELQYAIIFSLAEMVERRDNNTGGHVSRTSKYLRCMMTQIFADGVYRSDLEDIDVELYAHASQMHDVGKICIADNILLKKSKLSDSEYLKMKKHTEFGTEIIRTVMGNAQETGFLEIAEIFASAHHEKWNGTGYPLGLMGEDIPIGGRIMAIVDAYDAIRSERPYKAARSHEEAVAIIKQDSGSHFDPLLVNSFLKVAENFKKISSEEE